MSVQFPLFMDLDKAPVLPFQQKWLPQAEPGFQPGEVRVAWQPDGFCIHAVLQDRDAFNPEKGFNQPFFRQGDTFEWFVQPPGTETYWEFHIGPDAQLYQVRFPSKSAFDEVRSRGVPPDWMMDGQKIEAHTQLQSDLWVIEAFLPISMLERPRIRPNEVWRMSFCRYDYNRAPEDLILSSTSLFGALDFHRNFEWNQFVAF
jgi:hypothetical protein